MNCSDNDLLTVLRYIQQTLNETPICHIDLETQIGNLNAFKIQDVLDELLSFHYVDGYSVSPDIRGDEYYISGITDLGFHFIKLHS